MVLHVANDTKLNWVVQYRLTGGEGGKLLGPFILEIPSGQQRTVGAGWSQENEQFFVEQIERHGAIEARELDRTVKRHTGLLYSYDRQIEADRIEEGHSKVVDTQEKRSAEEATKAALGFDRMANQAGRGKRRMARATEVEVEELHDPRGRPTGKEMHFRLGVDAEGNQPVSTSID
jgi:hypothetical protein